MKSNKFMFIGVIVVVVLIMFYSLSSEQIDTDYLEDLTEFRGKKNDRFKNNETDSPFDKENRAEFDSLNYFAVNPYYRIQADYERLEENEVVEIPTTEGGEPQKYIRFGKAEFPIGRQRTRSHFIETLR